MGIYVYTKFAISNYFVVTRTVYPFFAYLISLLVNVLLSFSFCISKSFNFILFLSVLVSLHTPLI